MAPASNHATCHHRRGDAASLSTSEDWVSLLHQRASYTGQRKPDGLRERLQCGKVARVRIHVNFGRADDPFGVASGAVVPLGDVSPRGFTYRSDDRDTPEWRNRRRTQTRTVTARLDWRQAL